MFEECPQSLRLDRFWFGDAVQAGWAYGRPVPYSYLPNRETRVRDECAVPGFSLCTEIATKQCVHNHSGCSSLCAEYWSDYGCLCCREGGRPQTVALQKLR